MNGAPVARSPVLVWHSWFIPGRVELMLSEGSGSVQAWERASMGSCKHGIVHEAHGEERRAGGRRGGLAGGCERSDEGKSVLSTGSPQQL